MTTPERSESEIANEYSERIRERLHHFYGNTAAEHEIVAILKIALTTTLQTERQKRDEMVGAIEEFASYLEGKRIVVSRGASSGRKEDYPNFPEWAYKENVVSKREEIPNSVVAALLRDRLQPFTQTNNPK